MPRPSIDQVRGLGDFATTYQWNLTFVTFPSAVGEGGQYPSAEALNLRCETTDVPKVTNSKATANIRGHKKHQAGINDYAGQLNFTFVETVDNTIALLLTAWREACAASKTGTHQIQSEVEATIRIERLNRQDEKIWHYTLIGSFLEDYDLGQLQSENTELFKPQLTVSYDYFTENQ